MLSSLPLPLHKFGQYHFYVAQLPVQDLENIYHFIPFSAEFCKRFSYLFSPLSKKEDLGQNIHIEEACEALLSKRQDEFQKLVVILGLRKGL